jgi:hypothetical protein
MSETSDEELKSLNFLKGFFRNDIMANRLVVSPECIVVVLTVDTNAGDCRFYTSVAFGCTVLNNVDGDSWILGAPRS